MTNARFGRQKIIQLEFLNELQIGSYNIVRDYGAWILECEWS